jgi:hypothetical protein
MFVRRLLACAALLAALGCGGERTYKVAGTVTLEGKPVAQGSIVFESDSGGPGVFSSGIVAGKYELQAKVGKKKVIISAYRTRPGTENEPQPAIDEYIPARYNTKTELVREVMPADNHFDFALKK